ncbi:tail fiber assembly protein [Pseudomonas sessilinigenes]|uniref:Tail fiber assembly protein n=1 Tax=Pseudomonas sessilinigenes TaxID=658629 RepID=A0ABX8MTG2_9PSED|nr:tail fiber assembly protein [Pseudomonas sessilinigenes]AZC22919.1 hypothetical protein C4K39_1224 [Pseudomonas sessilinigenes]QXH41952.1 tail fiber assembly protein [Pseudomonas sessilinigenes]
MSYAVRKDGQGFRAIDGPEDIESHETYYEGVPPTPIALPLSAGEAANRAREAREQLLSVAANRMGPLQDAVERNKATPDEVRMLDMWKDYRIELNRIELQQGFPSSIVWPPVPGEQTP